MRKDFNAAIVCTGAVIGAGFASGREIVTFFARYGGDAWWLILLASSMMSVLCWLCMRRGKCTDWYGLFEGSSTGAQLCVMVLMILTGGAMLSAAGELAALSWYNEWAYSLGAAGTMIAAWLLGRHKFRVMGWVSGVLIALLVCAIILALRYAPESGGVLLNRMVNSRMLLQAAVRAAAYAAMNMTLAIGVVCRCAQQAPHRTSLIFGGLMALLLFTGNALYLRHPEVLDEPFPLVQVLRCFGLEGFRVSVVLLWLAVLTSLTAVLGGLDDAVSKRVHNPAWRAATIWCLPLCASKMGFSGIVDHLYAPAGMLCWLLVFAPLFLHEIQSCCAQRNA